MRLRIISGIFRGRQIAAPQSEHTRPTTDRVRESLFNYLTNKFSFDGITVLDIYSGSGSLGLEALSRGAASVTFIEMNFPPLKVLKENIASLQAEPQCTVIKTSALTFTKKQRDAAYDLILADPPFFTYDIHGVVRNVLEHNYLTEHGVMIVERSIQTIKADVEAFGREPYRRIGDACLYEFERGEEPCE